MHDTCISFAEHHHLTFNPDKTQLIKFYRCADTISPCFVFLGQSLSLRTSATHLGHILTHNFNDDEDIASAIKDMCCKANCMLHTFACCDPIVKTHLFSSFCLLRKIWSLPRHCHTAILHCVTRLPSMINTVLSRSSRLLLSVLSISLSILFDI